MQAALDHLRQQPKEVREEDVNRLLPLLHGHVNVLGRNSPTLAKRVIISQLRQSNQSLKNIIILSTWLFTVNGIN